MPTDVYNITGTPTPAPARNGSMDSKTLGAFRASGQKDIGSFLSDQGGDKETPPGVPSMAGGRANWQGTTIGERAASAAAGNAVLAGGGSIQAAHRAMGQSQKDRQASTQQTQQNSMMERLAAGLADHVRAVLGPLTPAPAEETPAPNTVMEAKAYGADPTKIVVASSGSGNLADRWRQ